MSTSQRIQRRVPTQYKSHSGQTLKYTLQSVDSTKFKPRVPAPTFQLAALVKPPVPSKAAEEPHTPRNAHRTTLRKVPASERPQLNWRTDSYWNNFDIDVVEYKRQLSTQYNGYLEHLPAGDTNQFKFKNNDTTAFLNDGKQLSSLVKSNPGHIILSKNGTKKMNESADSDVLEAQYLTHFVKWLGSRRGGTRKRKHRSMQKGIKGGVSKKSYNNILYKRRRRTFKRQ